MTLKSGIHGYDVGADMTLGQCQHISHFAVDWPWSVITFESKYLNSFDAEREVQDRHIVV